MKKNGFTMVELMVVISLIIVLSLLITPKINNIIKENRVKGYKEIEKQLEEAANKYIVENYIDTSLNSITLTKSQLMEKHYIDEILDLKDKTVCDASVLVTNLNATPNFTVQLNCSNYNSDNSAPQTGQLVYLNADLNGGKSSQAFGKSYPSGTTITLENPTKLGVVFAGWQVASGDSTISNGILTIGSSNTLIYALWSNSGLHVTPVLGEGGTTTQVFGEYVSGDSITLVDPIRDGYTFTGWTCSDPLALSGKTLTIGTTNLTITANWVISQDTLNSLYLMLEQERARLDSYPVGSIYISTSNTNPGTIFGGTWERYGKGKTLVSLDEEDTDFDTVNETGGEKTHQHLTSFGFNYNRAFFGISDSSNNPLYGSIVYNDVNRYYVASSDSKAIQDVGAVRIAYTQIGTTLQPYITTYMWKRTA